MSPTVNLVIAFGILIMGALIVSILINVVTRDRKRQGMQRALGGDKKIRMNVVPTKEEFI